MEKPDDIDIFNYFDYREYLREVYAFRKKNLHGFSHRSFARDAGIVSPNYLLRVMRGERNLADDYVPRFIAALKLKADEARYFEALIAFNNEKSAHAKEAALQKLLTLRYSRGEYRLLDKKLQFYEHWYYPVIRELAVILDFKEDYNLLARNCVPRITAVQAENAVVFLVKNGFIKKENTGRYSFVDPAISTGAEVNSIVLRKYHRATIGHFADALDAIPLENRDISSLTMSVSHKTYVAMKKEIQDFRKRLAAMVHEDHRPEMVCLAGFQLIPRSEVNKRTSDEQA